MIFISWFVLSLVVGAIGSGRKIGFWGAFFLSLILSPLIGLIIALTSKSKTDAAFQETMIKEQKIQNDMLKQQNLSLTQELERLAKLKYDGLISEDEFLLMKQKLIENQ